MTSAQAHRGPDGWGVRVLGPCGLGHRRLSIIDLSEGGAQPMSTADGKLWLTYNGEIYNYVELRSELEGLGCTFRSQSDTEVILQAYRVWGRDCFARFNGMWGLALYDVEARRLVLSRDRLGIKPLYIHRDANRLLFASEIKALLAVEPSLAEINSQRVAQFLHRPILGPGRMTFFERIEQIEPASIVTVDAQGDLRRDGFWDFRPGQRHKNVDHREAVETVRELMIDAVRLRFRSDVPVGTCLSGGLDSSSIVAIAGRELGKAPASFSAVYEEAAYDERKFVNIMVDELGLDGHPVSPDGRDFVEVMEKTNYFQEQPSAAPGIYSQWHVMNSASQHVKVLLDGQGGDEIFGGYFSFFTPYYANLLQRAVRGDVGSLSRALNVRGEIAELIGEDPLKTLVKQSVASVRRNYYAPARSALIRTMRARIEDNPTLYGLAQGLRSQVDKPHTPSFHLYHKDLRPLLDGYIVDPPVVSGDSFTDLLWDTLVRTSIPALLHYEDRNSMAYSIEARTPFLDYRLIEYAFHLPSQFKIDGTRTKAILRDAMLGILPEPIRDRKDKMGYPTPFGTWVRENHTDWIRDLLLSSESRQRGLTEHRCVEQALNEHLAGQRDHSWSLFLLVSLEMFLRRFIDQPFVANAPPSYAVVEDLRDPRLCVVS